MSCVIILISSALFLALILNLAAKPKFTAKLNGVLIPIAAVGGIIFYGAGFSAVLDDPLQMVIRTVFDVCRMFAGVNDFGAIGEAPFFRYQPVVTLFWLLHFMAFYATASATISMLGEKALKKLKYWLSRYGASIVIYGINDASLELGRSLIKGGAKHLVFVGSSPNPALEKAANEAGALVRTDMSALEPNRSFLKSLGSYKGSPVLTLYAMEEDAQANVAYAEKLLSALKVSPADTDHSSLILRGTDDSIESTLLNTPENGGYAEVRVFSDASVASRLLIMAMPPYKKMEFDGDGKAVGDFDAVVIGFGRTGHSVLRQLVCHSQFEGSHFRAAVFSPCVESETGYLTAAYPGLLASQDICFMNRDAKSRDFYEYLASHRSSLRYVVICTGDPARDAEIFSDVTQYLLQIRCHPAVCRCQSREILFAEDPEKAVEARRVFTEEAFSGASDRLARIINHSYVNDPSVSEEAAWKECDYFGRESSRAAADFSPAFLKMTGKTEKEVRDGAWDVLSDLQRENLARTEHLRWCAFYEAMGFSEMSLEVVRERGEVYRREKEQFGSSSLRITKDLSCRLHACLCPYDALPALSALEEQYTGQYKDYQDIDLRNVLSVAKLLAASQDN